MGRLVQPKPSSTGGIASPRAEDDNEQGDDFLDRLLKYIPAESVAFYLLVDRLVANNYGIEIPTTDKASDGGTAIATAGAVLPDPSAATIALGVFLVTLIATPIYFYRARDWGKPWKLHAVIATLAFVAWSYSIGGSVWVAEGLYSVFWAGLVAPIFTFLAGTLEPPAAEADGGNAAEAADAAGGAGAAEAADGT